MSIKLPTLLLLLYFSIFAISPKEFSKKAIQRTTLSIRYDGSYHRLTYPMGDVPSNIGVCTDVIIRTYREFGIDLQKLIHIDMVKNFSKYPSKRIWGLKRTDKNIDHRRVPNLRRFFTRNGKKLKVTKNPKDYRVGDLVTWKVGGRLPHIGIVADSIDEKSGNPLIVHNIGAGPKLEEMLFDYPITGHYRYLIK